MNQLKEKLSVSSSALKLIAIATMLIDHIGAVLQPEGNIYILLRSVGRLAFPLFCFMIVEGFSHTSDRKRYALRLGAFALISEIPFNLAFSGELFHFGSCNVFFTLFIGLLTIWVADEYRNKSYIGAGIILFGTLLAEIINCDYGWYGVAIIVAFYIFKNKKAVSVLSFIALTFLYVISNQWAVISIASSVNMGFVEYVNRFLNMSIGGYLANYCRQLLACLSAVFIVLYNGKKGFIKSKPLKYIFYIFYPAHLIILWLIKTNF